MLYNDSKTETYETLGLSSKIALLSPSLTYKSNVTIGSIYLSKMGFMYLNTPSVPEIKMF